MPKYRIALMPGDGIGKDVMEAAQIVLDKIALDAEYVPADIGWEFWCKEGEPLPERTLATLKTCTCALSAFRWQARSFCTCTNGWRIVRTACITTEKEKKKEETEIKERQRQKHCYQFLIILLPDIA